MVDILLYHFLKKGILHLSQSVIALTQKHYNLFCHEITQFEEQNALLHSVKVSNQRAF